MKTQLKLTALIVIYLVAHIAKGQRPPIVTDPCPNPNGSQRAQFSVRFFLTFPAAESARIETGATNETIEQIRPVADATICSALNQIVLNTPKYKSVDDNLDVRDTKYYYRTDNLYYIFWDRKLEHDNKISGPRTLFIVVSADYQNIWEYYF